MDYVLRSDTMTRVQLYKLYSTSIGSNSAECGHNSGPDAKRCIHGRIQLLAHGWLVHLGPLVLLLLHPVGHIAHILRRDALNVLVIRAAALAAASGSSFSSLSFDAPAASAAGGYCCCLSPSRFF